MSEYRNPEVNIVQSASAENLFDRLAERPTEELLEVLSNLPRQASTISQLKDAMYTSAKNHLEQ